MASRRYISDIWPENLITANNANMPPSRCLSPSPVAEPEDPTTITTTEELNRFASYVEFRTRDLQNSVQAFVRANQTTEPDRIFHETEEEDEGLVVEVGRFNDQFADWVGVTDDAVDCPEVQPIAPDNHTRTLPFSLLLCHPSREK